MADNVVDGRVGLPVVVAQEPASAIGFAPAKSHLLFKRSFDFLVSALLLILLAPVFAAITVLIRADSPGSTIFRQNRIGKDARVFTIYKFRTMVSDAPAYSYKVAIGDARITRVGAWLRRSGLDELPQLWNVLRGDMSLIGPRPELPFIVEQHQGWDHPRFSVRPGITGWWQIHHRNDVPMHLDLEYDNYYLEHLSWALDWMIARTTVGLIVKGVFRPA